MKCVLRAILYLSLISAFGCNNNSPLNSTPDTDGVVSQPNILRNFDPRLISTLQDKQERSIKLNDLIKNLETSSFYINDNIVFSKDENGQANKNITLHVHTQCIESETQKKFTQNVSMEYKDAIMLIELIPEQLFSYGNSWWLNETTYNPTCSFQFEAKNKAGDIHIFELPHLPILSFDNSQNLSLIEQQIPSNEVERVSQFPILKFDQIEDYAVISGKNTTVDQLKLICETFNLSFDVDDLIHYDLWKLQGWASIEQEARINQPCRFVSFNDEHVVGISQLFPIVFQAQEMTTQLITDFTEIEALKDHYPLSVEGYDFNGISQMMSDFKKDNSLGSYHNLAVLKIENSSADQVHLYIPNTSFYTNTHFFYNDFFHEVLIEDRMYLMYDKGVFVTMPESAQFILTPSLIKAKDQNMEVSDEGYHIVYENNHALLTLTAGATALIPLSVNIERQCDFKNNWTGEERMLNNIQNVGMVFEGDILPIYRVLDVTDVESAQKTIIGSIMNNPQQNAFRLDVGLTPTRNINKHFYNNTCTAFQTSRFDPISIAHQGTWKLQSKNKKIQFTKDPNHSLSEEQNKFIRNKVNEIMEHQELARRN
ncbi:MAG: hypothetical protein OXK80_05185 [Bdellovibrionales bacterium]|nr:hypothetical protein [Bdellovibrionales bacterium]